jgi:peptidyl-prolyl cis-trans isomerase SurA
MKKLFIFLLLTCITQAVISQVLFTYGSNAVTKNEFLRAYNKNKTAVTDKAMALREYLDLYIRFKLKVKAAKDLRIDTLSSLARELQNFRTQIEENYLNDEGRVNELIQESFNRSQKDIHIAYLFFPVNTYKDSLAADQAYRSSKPKWIDPGFITVFSLPYEFENVIYSLPVSGESKIIRGNKGWYIFKNIEERKALGKIKIAQILMAVPQNATEEEKAGIKKVVDSVYNALLAGADFGEAAKKFSNDQMSYMTGGMIPEFGVGTYDPEFENKVFSIAKDSMIAPPFLTKFGYHIVKRLSLANIPADRNNENFLFSLKQRVMQDSRITTAKDKFVNDVLKKLNYKNLPVKQNDLWKLTDSFVISNKKIALPGISPATPLFNLDKKNIKVSDWLAFVKKYKPDNPASLETNEQLMKKFLSATALDAYKKKLPELNPEFKYQLDEFRDGNMLFEVMEKNVWNKASNDNAGLKNYYEKNKAKYTWNESADAVIFSASNEKAALDAAAELQKGKSWKQVAEENLSTLQTDSARYELTQLPAKAGTKFIEGLVSAPLVNENDGTATFVKVLKIYPAGMQRSFEEARGLVINDYQVFLEENWITQLKKKYPVTVNEKVFQSLL